MNLGIGLGVCSCARPGCIFDEFRNLTIIKLSKDDLFQFSELEFPGKKNVLAMDLSENTFSSFPKHLPTSVESLNLENNDIEAIDCNEMRLSNSLRKLIMARNNMRALWQNAFNGLGKLQLLDLAGNIFRVQFSLDVFEPLQNLTHLYINSSKIKSLHTKLSTQLVSLRVLDLSDNDCEVVDKLFSEMFPSLQILHLEANNFGKFYFHSNRGGNLFSGLASLEQVFISSNNISELPDLIFRDQVS